MNNTALTLYETAERSGLISALQPFGKNINIKIPYSIAFSKLPIDNFENPST